MRRGFSIEDRGDVTVIRFLRTVSKQEIFEIIDVIATRGQCNKRLWLLGEYLRLSAEEMAEIGEYGRTTIAGPGRVAYVADDDLTFGLTSIHAAYRKTGGYEDQLFRDEASAMAWLSEGHVEA